MTWGELKKKVESLGVLDDTVVTFIDVDSVDRREDDAHAIQALVTSYPGVGIVDDRADRRTLPGPGDKLRL